MTEMVKKPGTDRRHTCWTLARLAGCGDPDRADVSEHLGQTCDGRGYGGGCTICDGSPGARFLRSVEDAVYEAWEYATEEYNGDDPADMVKLMQTDGRVTELADSAVPVYTHERWGCFVDLAAYQEEIEGGMVAEENGIVDMVGLAGVALYMIAERLAWALLEELTEEREEPIWIGVTSGQVVTITTPEGEEIRGKVETYDADEIHVESLDTDSYGSHRMMLFTRDEVATIG